MNAVELSLFASRMEAVCEEMGVVLRRTAFSPNIKDRLDFSCALFDARGELCAQAAHIPVHLGSMAFAMRDVVSAVPWQEGDMLVLNDPFMGGTHLPDVSLIAPLFRAGKLLAFVVNRAHHANIGAETPGSMPNSTSLAEEGVVIPPSFLFRQGDLNKAVWALFPGQRQDEEGRAHLSGDLAAQVSACKVGVLRLGSLIDELPGDSFPDGLRQLNEYGARLAQNALAAIPDGRYSFTDYLDDDGAGNECIKICVSLSVEKGSVLVDFDGTAPQVKGNVNCPLSVAAAAVYYVFRCLMPDQTPACAGVFRGIALQAQPGCLVNALGPAAVAAGNVETSSRIVDVVLGALQQALPQLIPAASQGTMNNVAMGKTGAWDYYETLAGGMGGGPNLPGLKAVHTHMTNTLNTPVESLEMHYPVRIRHYGLHQGSAGAGKHPGGEGLVREYEFLESAQVSLLTERRRLQPWGLAGGGPGGLGRNLLNGREVGAKTSFAVGPGDRLTIKTPGGGGWGDPA